MKNSHVFKALDRFFLFDVTSNSLFIIEEPVYSYLKGEKVEPQHLKVVLDDIAELKTNGYLNESPDNRPELKRAPILKALCLHISHDCNLRCNYCFAGTGPFGGDREQMSYEVGKAALDFLLRESGSKRNLEVDFFGGEPLLNLDVVKQLVAYGEENGSKLGKELHFTLTTNGIKLDEAARCFLNDHQIAVVLSLDGRPEINDRMRGRGTYQQIVPKFLKLIEGRDFKNYYLRGTFTSFNPDFSQDVKHLYDLGFREISLEPVVSPEGDYRLTEEHINQIEDEYERLACYYLDRRKANDGFTFFHFEIDLEHGPCLPKRLTGCGAGFDYFAVTPAGELYPCHQFVGRSEFRMGDVWQGLVRNDLQEQFGAATLYQKKGCSDCWSRFFCSGGCHANAQQLSGSIYQPDQLGCSLQRKRLECALAIRGLLLEEGSV